MQFNKNLLSILVISAIVCLFIFGFKPGEIAEKETVIFSVYNTDMILTFADGKQELIPFEKIKPQLTAI